MPISTLKMRCPTSSKLHQGKGFLVHTQPCGEYLSSFTAFVSISKLFAKICPVEKQDQSIGLGG